jgi:hypothetical protein
MGRNSRNLQNKRPAMPPWNDIAGRFSTDGECLAAFLAFAAAATIEGAKPSTLLNLTNRRHPCGRNLYQLWKSHGSDLLQASDLEARELVDHGDSLLLFIYSRAGLERILARRSVGILLRRTGYPRDMRMESVLNELQSRLLTDGFPHELGIILGYPLKDVAGFMGWGNLPCSRQGPWKIYGNPRESLKLADTHRQCRCRMARRLISGCGPYECLGITSSTASSTPSGFFYPTNENENQY